MKRRLSSIFLGLIVTAVLVYGGGAAGAQRRDADRPEFDDLPERDEIHQTFELPAGAKVEVKGINGTVDVETSSGTTARVDIVRSARNREDLAYRKIIVEQTATGLVVRGEKDQGGWGHDRNVRQRVMLNVPRNIELSASGVNGRTSIGEVDGPVNVSGINGKVDVAQAAGYSNLSGINGKVTITIARLGERGIHASGINGGVELRFVDEVNADVDVTGINGSVNADVPNVTLLGKIDRQNFHAKIGSGGSPIKVTGINGHVRIVRAGTSG